MCLQQRSQRRHRSAILNSAVERDWPGLVRVQGEKQTEGERRDRETKGRRVRDVERESSRLLSQTNMHGLIAAAFLLRIMFPPPACWQVAMWLQDPFNTESEAAGQTHKPVCNGRTHTHTRTLSMDVQPQWSISVSNKPLPWSLVLSLPVLWHF